MWLSFIQLVLCSTVDAALHNGAVLEPTLTATREIQIQDFTNMSNNTYSSNVQEEKIQFKPDPLLFTAAEAGFCLFYCSVHYNRVDRGSPLPHFKFPDHQTSPSSSPTPNMADPQRIGPHSIYGTS